VGDIDLRDAGDRERILASGPTGAWRSLTGSFEIVMHDEVWFGPDGDGTMRHFSGSGDWQMQFRWRLESRGVLGLRELSVSEPDDEADAWGDSVPSDETDSEDLRWLTVPFDIRPCATDVGTFWALHVDWIGWLDPLVPA
jgi:hypothetical protein